MAYQHWMQLYLLEKLPSNYFDKGSSSGVGTKLTPFSGRNRIKEGRNTLTPMTS